MHLVMKGRVQTPETVGAALNRWIRAHAFARKELASHGATAWGEAGDRACSTGSKITEGTTATRAPGGQSFPPCSEGSTLFSAYDSLLI